MKYIDRINRVLDEIRPGFRNQDAVSKIYPLLGQPYCARAYFDAMSWFDVVMEEVSKNPDDTALKRLLLVRIIEAMESLKDMLDKDIECMKKIEKLYARPNDCPNMATGDGLS
jgi:hypothetical protein